MRARWILLGALLPYVGWLIFGYRYHFLDGVNLLLHEAGHVLFGFFGQTLHFLGGTLGQLLFPVLFTAYFWRQGKRFEAFVVLVWLAESLMYTAEYMADARRMVLPLVGGHIHDWNWLFARWGLLSKAEELGEVVHVLASALALGALGLAALEIRSSTVPGRPADPGSTTPTGAGPPAPDHPAPGAGATPGPRRRRPRAASTP